MIPRNEVVSLDPPGNGRLSQLTTSKLTEAYYSQNVYLSRMNSSDLLFFLSFFKRVGLGKSILRLPEASFAPSSTRTIIQYPIAFPPNYGPPIKPLNRILNHNHRGFLEAHI